jgi:hypothetical protein
MMMDPKAGSTDKGAIGASCPGARTEGTAGADTAGGPLLGTVIARDYAPRSAPMPEALSAIRVRGLARRSLATSAHGGRPTGLARHEARRNLGHVAYCTEDLYRDDDVLHGHLYQRHVGLLRLADVLEDQLLVEEDAALVLAAELISVGEHEA